MKNLKILCLYLTVALAAICAMALSSKAAEQPISGTFSVLVSASRAVDGGLMQIVGWRTAFARLKRFIYSDK